MTLHFGVTLTRQFPPPCFIAQSKTASLLSLHQQIGQRAKACIDNTHFMVAVNMRPLFNMWIYGCVWPMYLQAQHFLLAHICPHYAQKDSNSMGLFSQLCLHTFSSWLAHFALLCRRCCGIELRRKSALFVCTLVFLYRLTDRSKLIWWVLPLKIKQTDLIYWRGLLAILF